MPRLAFGSAPEQSETTGGEPAGQCVDQISRNSPVVVTHRHLTYLFRLHGRRRGQHGPFGLGNMVNEMIGRCAVEPCRLSGYRAHHDLILAARSGSRYSAPCSKSNFLRKGISCLPNASHQLDQISWPFSALDSYSPSLASSYCAAPRAVPQ